MDGVAIHASHVVFKVLRTEEVRMFFAELMAAQATLGGLFPRQTGKTDDLGGISRLGMFFARPVTGLAALPLRPLVFGEGRLPVRSLVETLAHVFVASLAGVGPHILRGIGLVIFRFLGGNVFWGVLLALLRIAVLGLAG